MFQENQRGNSKFAFLFGGEFSQYYQWKVEAEKSALAAQSHAQEAITASAPWLTSTSDTSTQQPSILGQPPVPATVGLNPAAPAPWLSQPAVTAASMVAPPPWQQPVSQSPAMSASAPWLPQPPSSLPVPPTSMPTAPWQTATLMPPIPPSIAPPTQAPLLPTNVAPLTPWQQGPLPPVPPTHTLPPVPPSSAPWLASTMPVPPNLPIPPGLPVPPPTLGPSVQTMPPPFMPQPPIIPPFVRISRFYNRSTLSTTFSSF
jgi:hypothetical protein